MLTSNFIVTTKIGKVTLYLKPDGLATGFVAKAKRFRERTKAQRAADFENVLRSKAGAKIWQHTDPWTVAIQSFDAIAGKES